MKLYSMPSSGNSYKVRLALALLGRDYTHVACENASPEWEAQRHKAPLGKLPFLELEDGQVLAESNAILWFIAQDSTFVPRDPLAQARVLAWMFFEQNRHEPVIAVRAALRTYPERRHLATPERMAELLSSGQTILKIMDDHLAQAPWFGADNVSVADLALFGYTHTADSHGGFDLTALPHLCAWRDRIAALPGFVPLTPGA